MMNLGSTLDTVIAMVIVLVVLSMIVQAIQSLVKKVFKMKSRIVTKSLTDLLQYSKNEVEASAETKTLVEDVKKQFGKLGWLSFWKNPIVESVSKDDLMKILSEIKPGAADNDLRTKAEKWFDTVWRGFDERYARHMKSFAVVISILVVVYLNANIFRVYQSIAHNDVQRSLIVSKGEEILASAKKQTEAEAKSTATSTSTPTPSPTPSPTPRTRPTQSAPANSEPNPPTKPTPGATSTPDDGKAVAEAARQVDDYVSTYKQFGFSPVTWEQVGTWLASVQSETQVRDAKGRILGKANQVIERDCAPLDKDGKPILDKNGQPVDCQSAWRAMTGSEWWASRGADVQVLVGWALMTLLLSVGAPFWEDALGSLFGIKNLLQKKGKKDNGKDSDGD
jgi:type II secretory pathway component PulC